jgi:hypothetical protein
VENPDAAGVAALSICESMLLCLADLRVLSEADLIGLLDDAAAAHLAPDQSAAEAARGAEVASIITAIAAGNNSVRRRSTGPTPDTDD